MQLAKKKLDDRGTSSIIPYRRSQNAAGERTFSCPHDGEALEKYSKDIGNRGHILCVDVYCDGIALPNGGSQTLSPLRVRFSNIRGIEKAWFDIGLYPTLPVGISTCSSGKLTELRNELLHRYLFLVFHPLIEASNTGFKHSSCVMFPRILMILCDQKQEWPLVGLKSTGSTRDFTSCSMLSRLTSAERATYTTSSARQSTNSNNSPITPSSSQESICNSDTGPSTSSGGLDVQLEMRGGEDRNVVRTLGVQLILTLARLKKKKDEPDTPLLQKLRRILPSFWFNKLNVFWMNKSKSGLKILRQYTIQYSCTELPPFLATIHGLGTEPFLLYKCIAFDSLHAIDLDILRTFPDSCFIHFGAQVNYTSIPTSQCIGLGNSRLRMIPRGYHISKIPLFIEKSGQQLAGVTCLVRRQSFPFLWICVLGLNTKLTPDTDPLLQAALEFNDIQCQLMGINEDYSSIQRSSYWMHRIQQQCFELGERFTTLFFSKVNTKLHRVMRHIETHMKSFGMLRWGATDNNETRHKSLKVAYKNTNRRLDSLSVRLLNSGYAHDSGTPSDGDTPAVLNSMTEPIGSIYMSGAHSTTIEELNINRPLQRILDRVINLNYSNRRSVVCCSLSYFTLRNNFSWSVDSNVQYVMENYTYRKWSTCSEDLRMDGCVYQLGTVSVHGLVQAIIRNRKYPNQVFFITRRLRRTCIAANNTLVSLLSDNIKFSGSR